MAPRAKRVLVLVRDVDLAALLRDGLHADGWQIVMPAPTVSDAEALDAEIDCLVADSATLDELRVPTTLPVLCLEEMGGAGRSRAGTTVIAQPVSLKTIARALQALSPAR